MSTAPSSHANEDSSALTARPGRFVLLALLALTLFGGWLRLAGAGCGLPARQNYDEKYLLDELDLLREGRPDARADPAFGIYPQLLPQLARLLAPRPAEARAAAPAEELEQAGRDLLVMRVCAALLALLAVPCTFLLARRFLDERGALLAAALMSASVLQVWYSAQARPHAPASGAMALALFAALEIRRHGRPSAYALAALATVLALGSSQIALFLLPSLLLAHLLRPRDGTRRADACFLAALALVAASAFVLCPSWFPGASTFSPVELRPRAFVGRGVARLALGLWHYEPLLAGLALAALLALAPAALARRRGRRLLEGREDLAILLATALPYLLVILLFNRSAQRYFLPLLPLAAILAAALLGKLPRARTALGLALFALQAALCVQITRVLRAPDTSQDAARWIERELDPARARIALLPAFDLPLAREPESLARGFYLEQKPSPWARWQSSNPRAGGWKLFTLPLHGTALWKQAAEDPRAFLDAAGADYVVLELEGRPILDTVVEPLRSCTELVARFSPMREDSGDNTPFLWWDHQTEYREGPSWIARLCAARSLGSVLELRRVPR